MLPVIQANIVASQDGPLAPEQWAKLAMDKIISVNEDAPEKVREQVLEYKVNIEKLLSLYFAQAMESAERHTIKRYE